MDFENHQEKIKNNFKSIYRIFYEYMVERYPQNKIDSKMKEYFEGSIAMAELEFESFTDTEGEKLKLIKDEIKVLETDLSKETNSNEIKKIENQIKIKKSLLLLILKEYIPKLENFYNKIYNLPLIKILKKNGDLYKLLPDEGKGNSAKVFEDTVADISSFNEYDFENVEYLEKKGKIHNLKGQEVGVLDSAQGEITWKDESFKEEHLLKKRIIQMKKIILYSSLNNYYSFKNVLDNIKHGGKSSDIMNYIINSIFFINFKHDKPTKLEENIDKLKLIYQHFIIENFNAEKKAVKRAAEEEAEAAEEEAEAAKKAVAAAAAEAAEEEAVAAEATRLRALHTPIAAEKVAEIEEIAGKAAKALNEKFFKSVISSLKKFSDNFNKTIDLNPTERTFQQIYENF